MDILPFGFEAEYALEMWKIKTPRVYTWEEGQYPEGPCARCVARFLRANKAMINMGKEADHVARTIAALKPPISMHIEIDMSQASVTKFEEAVTTGNALKTRSLKFLNNIIYFNSLKLILLKKEVKAFWKMTECGWKRQRPFMYAHNSINA